VVELHTGAYCEAVQQGRKDDAQRLLEALQMGALEAHARGLEVHAGHGLDYETVGPVAAIPQIAELNIGHFLIGEAIFVGLEAAMGQMRALMQAARGGQA
jgi:pyridoxine 5-phosphate synthase